MKKFTEAVLYHANRYPMMRPCDFIKLAYQAQFGSSHLTRDLERAKAAFMSEWEHADNSRVMQPLCEDVGEDIIRINLGAAKERGFDAQGVFDLFILGSKEAGGDESGFEGRINILSQLAADGKLPFSFFTFTQELAFYLASGADTQPNHSELFKQAYSPAYRIIPKKYEGAIKAFDALKEKITADNAVIAIDGRCGSGKSSVASGLSALVGYPIVHMDHFFLPPDMRTTERYSTPGGNFHIERFLSEVAPHLKSAKPFEYGIFDCSRGEITQSKAIAFAKNGGIIVEGAYSLHPDLRHLYSVKIFCDAPLDIRLERIAKRDGETILPMFTQRWIPLEEAYLSAFDIQSKCDMIIS